MTRALFLLLLLATACRNESAGAGGGDVARGRQLVETQYLCGACHSIPGIQGPKGKVGPPLEGIARRQLIGGKVPNNPENMIRWLQNPQVFDPGNAMPNLGMDARDARDVAAFLFTLE